MSDLADRLERVEKLREEVAGLQEAWEDEGAEWGDRLAETLADLHEAEAALQAGVREYHARIFGEPNE